MPSLKSKEQIHEAIPQSRDNAIFRSILPLPFAFTQILFLLLWILVFPLLFSTKCFTEVTLTLDIRKFENKKCSFLLLIKSA